MSHQAVSISIPTPYDTPIPYVQSYGKPRRAATRECDSRWLVVRCGCGHKPVLAFGCMAEDCTRCSTKLGIRRAARAIDRINARRAGRPLLYTVLTVPPDMHLAAADRKTWQRWRKAIVRYLKKHHGFDYGFESSHPTGSDLRNFHPHLNLIWLQRPGHRPFIDLAKFRAAWSAIIGADESVVHHQWVTKPSKIWHRIRYVVRPFPGWSHWRGSLRWYGSYPKKSEYENQEDRSCCEDCESKLIGIGYVSDDAVERYYKWGRQELYLLEALE